MKGSLLAPTLGNSGMAGSKEPKKPSFQPPHLTLIFFSWIGFLFQANFLFGDALLEVGSSEVRMVGDSC